jgi:hypothetical protein
MCKSMSIGGRYEVTKISSMILHYTPRHFGCPAWMKQPCTGLSLFKHSLENACHDRAAGSTAVEKPLCNNQHTRRCTPRPCVLDCNTGEPLATADSRGALGHRTVLSVAVLLFPLLHTPTSSTLRHRLMKPFFL